MASCSKSKNNNGRLLFKPETPHFFKIFHGRSINLHKLAIPRKFARFYGRNLQSSVVLKVPNGSKWLVEIVRSNGGIWLQNGWREFAEYYSVVDGSMLVFEYEKSASEFSVIIFDKTTTEINYPFEDVVDDQEQVPGREPNVVVHEAEIDVSVEISPSNSKGRSQRGKKSTFTRKKTLSKAEKAKAQPKGSSDSPKRPRLPRTCNVHCENQTRKKIKLENSVGECPYKEQVEVGLRGSKKTKASDQGKKKDIGTPRSNFSSGNPTFKRVMKPSNFFYNNKYFLRVPRNFVKNTEQKSQKLKLQVDGNKMWYVTLNIYPTIGIFGKVWFEFARENSLEA